MSKIPMKERRPLLCLNFDGVIHSYTTPWKGIDVIPDPPVAGALAWMLRAAAHWDMAVFSARSVPTTDREVSGVRAMRKWLVRWLVEEDHLDKHKAFNFVHQDLQWPIHKPPALLTIDDMGLRFDGNWDALDPVALLDLQPWNHHLRHRDAQGGA